MQWKSGLALLFILASAPASAQILPQSRRDRQRTMAAGLAPVPIDLRPGVRSADREPTRTFRVRVWAASDYRNQMVGWQSHFRRLVERVNQRVGRWPNVRFELTELKEWQRDSSAGID